MIKVIKSLFLGLLFLSCFHVYGADRIDNDSILDEETRAQFDYTFMEGLRLKMLGDYKSALSVFDQCMRIYDGSAAVRYEIAGLLAIGEDFTVSLQLIREAVEMEPKNIWYKMLLANILQRRAMIEEACNVYDQMIELDPDNEDYYFIQMELYTSIEKWNKAIQVMDKYERKFGISEPISIEKTNLYLKLEDTKKAIAEIEALMKKFPERSDYIGLIAEIYLNNNQEKKGLKLLNNILKKEPDNGFVQFYLTDYFYNKKDSIQFEKYLHNALVNDEVDNSMKTQYILKLLIYDTGVKLSEEHIYDYVKLLLEKYPDDVAVRTLNVDFLKKQNDVEGSQKELEYIITKEKNNYYIWEELLLIYNQLGDTDSMYEKGLEAINYFPNEPLPYVMVSLYLLINEKYDEAEPYLRSGLSLSDDNPFLQSQFYVYLGDVYHKRGEIKKTFEMYDEALKLNPNDIVTLNNYSYYLSLREERLDEAEKMISLVISVEANNPTYLDTYAWVLFKRKDYSLAKFYIKSAIEKSETPSAVLYDHYGDILFMNGEVEEAKEMWQKAIDLDIENIEEIRQKIVIGLPTVDEK